MNITNNKNCNIKINGKSYNDISAEEMFEKLGYEYKGNNYQYIIYENRQKMKTIWFEKISKTFLIFGIGIINNEELQAINKQVEELGWNNENN